MTLPTSEPLPVDESSQLPPARRRRKRRLLIPSDTSQRAAFLQEMADRVIPSVDFFLFSLLAGLVLAAAIRLDEPALFVLAALVAPFLGPVFGLSLATVAGSARFFVQSFGSILVGSLLALLGGVLGGLLVTAWPGATFEQALMHARFTWADFGLLTLGAGLTVFLMIRTPKSRPLVSSVAIAYELYLPAAVAGFGLVSKLPDLWPDGLIVFAVHLAWAVLVGAIVLVVLGLRPFNLFGYTMGTTLVLAGIIALIVISGMGTAVLARAGMPPLPPTATPTATITITPSLTPVPPTATLTPTRTLVPTKTFTLTVSPAPTPVWARISAQNADGAFIRAEPDASAATVKTLLNGIMVQVLEDVEQDATGIWVKVRTMDDVEGWILRTLLATATPAPGW